MWTEESHRTRIVGLCEIDTSVRIHYILHNIDIEELSTIESVLNRKQSVCFYTEFEQNNKRLYLVDWSANKQWRSIYEPIRVSSNAQHVNNPNTFVLE